MHSKRALIFGNKHFFILLIILFNVLSAVAQKHAKQEPKPLTKEQAQSVKRDASTLFAAGSYELALKAYLALYKSDPKNADCNFRIGYCYLMTDINKAEAVKYLEYAVENDTKGSKVPTGIFLICML